MKLHANKFAVMASEINRMRRNITRADIDIMSEKEKIELTKEETQLTSTWNSAESVSSLLRCPTCESPEHLYIYSDNKTAYCLDCAMECDLLDCDSDGSLIEMYPEELQSEDDTYTLEEMVSDDPRLAAELAEKILASKAEPSSLEAARKQVQNQTKNYLPKHKHVYSSSKSSNGTITQTGFDYPWPKCTHRPQHIIAGEGWGVWAGKKDDCRAFANEYDLVLNLTYTSIRTYTHVMPIPELKKWEHFGYKYTELQLDWPDYGVINLPREFWLELIEYAKANKKRILVFCMGGHGRTGTALGVMLCLALGYSPKEAIQWIRKNYCQNAIETKGQENYIYTMAGKEIPPVTPEPKKDEAASLAASKSN